MKDIIMHALFSIADSWMFQLEDGINARVAELLAADMVPDLSYELDYHNHLSICKNSNNTYVIMYDGVSPRINTFVMGEEHV